MFGKQTRRLVEALVSGVALSVFAQPIAVSAQTNLAKPSGAVEEVVVTARRRNEALKDVPIAVTNFSAEQLQLAGAQDITALQLTTPNLTLQVARGSNTTMTAFIRGIGQQDPL